MSVPKAISIGIAVRVAIAPLLIVESRREAGQYARNVDLDKDSEDDGKARQVALDQFREHASSLGMSDQEAKQRFEEVDASEGGLHRFVARKALQTYVLQSLETQSQELGHLHSMPLRSGLSASGLQDGVGENPFASGLSEEQLVLIKALTKEAAERGHKLQELVKHDQELVNHQAAQIEALTQELYGSKAKHQHENMQVTSFDVGRITPSAEVALVDANEEESPQDEAKVLLTSADSTPALKIAFIDRTIQDEAKVRFPCSSLYSTALQNVNKKKAIALKDANALKQNAMRIAEQVRRRKAKEAYDAYNKDVAPIRTKLTNLKEEKKPHGLIFRRYQEAVQKAKKEYQGKELIPQKRKAMEDAKKVWQDETAATDQTIKDANKAKAAFRAGYVAALEKVNEDYETALQNAETELETATENAEGIRSQEEQEAQAAVKECEKESKECSRQGGTYSLQSFIRKGECVQKPETKSI
eukprot:gnl/MRDRNA2_/MRDRNA2_63819_c0_seq1.p1 gnl/MRDRNA2_/MRDRNA2_63819_c0~~gnl/MRDRNA2_/MRDRNA2_63819_c0_seq1.p1  ORF type:complete len:474 (+),score=116.89 gnl/MRDRNA2_/MRDRNA2_63819_c0_seq1:124-1545(+)